MLTGDKQSALIGMKTNVCAEILKHGLSFLLICAISTGCIYDGKLIDGILNAKTIWFLFVAAISLFFLAILLFRSKLKISVNLLDVLILALFFYIIVSDSFFNGGFYSKGNLEDLALISFYCIFKVSFSSQLFSIKWLAVGVMFLTFLQIIVSVFQWFSYFPSFNNSFRFTGFFFNPAPFSIYLSILLIGCLVIFQHSQSRFTKYSSLTLFITGLPVVMISQCRAAWIAFVFSMIYLILITRNENNAWQRRPKLSRILLFFFLVVGIPIIGRCLYQFKKDSADGRLLIYKVAVSMITSHPVSGSGGGSFRNMFLEYQSKYFFTHQDKMSTDGKLADQVWYAFNDILQFTAEHGALGFILILWIAVEFAQALHKLKDQQRHRRSNSYALFRCAFATTLLIIVSGFFSYPLEMLPLRVIFMGSLAFLSAYVGQIGGGVWCLTSGISRPIGKFFVRIALFSLAAFFLTNLAEIYATLNLNVNENAPVAVGRYTNLLSDSPGYILNKVNFLLRRNDLNEAVHQLQTANKRNSDPLFIYALSDIYISQNKIIDAEKQYKFLYYALPGNMKPKYLLAKLYFKTGQNTKWELIANEIINFKPKVRSRVIDNMIFEITSMKAAKITPKYINR